jgi:hypothetical protein
VHAAKIGAERANDIADVIRYVIDEVHGSVLHITLTARHNKGQSLKETARAVSKAWAFVGRHRWWKYNLDAEYGREGFCRAMEVTWGHKNGWHPHLHILLFLGRPVDDHEAHALAEKFREVYGAGLRKHGFTCNAHGVEVRKACTDREAETVLARYLTKIAHEVTRQDRKTAKTPGRYTPFQLLAEAAATQDKTLLAIAHEYEQGTIGRRQLTWSGKRKGHEDERDIRTRAGLRDERTDEEIAEDDIASPDAFYVMPDQWRRLVPHRVAVMDAAERDGLAAAIDVLDAAGVRWLTPAERADRVARRLDGDAPGVRQIRDRWQA